jgi:hypothetical protein
MIARPVLLSSKTPVFGRRNAAAEIGKTIDALLRG